MFIEGVMPTEFDTFYRFVATKRTRFVKLVLTGWERYVEQRGLPRPPRQTKPLTNP